MIFLFSCLKSKVDGNGDQFVDQWKVLIYDEDCRDIISPILNVGALRQKGITLHLMVNIFIDYFLIVTRIYDRFIPIVNQYQMLLRYIFFVLPKLTSNELLRIAQNR